MTTTGYGGGRGEGSLILYYSAPALHPSQYDDMAVTLNRTSTCRSHSIPYLIVSLVVVSTVTATVHVATERTSTFR